MFQWLSFLKPAPKQPEVALKAYPVDLNSSVDVRAERNRQRCKRLVAALATEKDADRRASIRAELARRQQFGK